MYNLVTIADLIQISPQDCEKRSARALTDNINAKYANKVIQKIGLCVCLFDILKFSEGLIGHGTGIVNVHVDFRLIVFRPFKGEILQGRIVESQPEGIRISMEFFNDIFVPGPHMLFDNSLYNLEEDCWIWTTDDGVPFYFDKNEAVHFRVEGESWTDITPSKRPGAQADDDTMKSPYSITASMQQTGLGPLLWWSGEEVGGEEGE